MATEYSGLNSIDPPKEHGEIEWTQHVIFWQRRRTDAQGVMAADIFYSYLPSLSLSKIENTNEQPGRGAGLLPILFPDMHAVSTLLVRFPLSRVAFSLFYPGHDTLTLFAILDEETGKWCML